MCLFVTITCGTLSNDGFKSRSDVREALSAQRRYTATVTPEQTPISRIIHDNPAPSSSSNERPTVATQPSPARNVPWMAGSKEYQPQQPPTIESRFKEEWLDENEQRLRGCRFWHHFCVCCSYGIGPVPCCLCV